MQHKGHPVSTSLTSPAAPLAQPGSGQSRPPARRPWFSASWADRLFAALARGAALLTLALLLGVLVSLVIGAWPAIAQYGLGFLTSTAWDPVQNEYGGLVMVYGTLATSLIALLIAVPVAFHPPPCPGF